MLSAGPRSAFILRYYACQRRPFAPVIEAGIVEAVVPYEKQVTCLGDFYQAGHGFAGGEARCLGQAPRFALIV